MRSVICALARVALFGFVANSNAQGFPGKPVRFIVPYAPGGGTDIVARIIGQKLGDAWSQPVVIDNRPGAGSTVGTALAVKAPADGYTLVMSSISLAFDTTIYEFNTWYGIQVPAATPRAVINRINADVLRALQGADVRGRFAAGGLDPLASTPEAFGTMVRSEITKWTKVATAIAATK